MVEKVLRATLGKVIDVQVIQLQYYFQTVNSPKELKLLDLEVSWKVGLG